MLPNKSQMKQTIMDAAYQAKHRNQAAIAELQDTVSLTEYRALVRNSPHGPVWTDALQAALDRHEIIVIPPSEQIYWLDHTVVIPSNRRIEATGAVIRMVPEYPFVMMCNQHVHDGTPAPIDTSDRDTNISIHGGCWDEGATVRGARRFHEDPDTFKGVQTCMLFNNLDHLTLTDVTFSHVTSFCVQVGDLTDGVFENFFFVSCFADGLHVNGNSENLLIRNFSGHVGDDLVALNMYDWLGSSINYGPCKNVFCEDIHSAPDSSAKAMRLQPGIFIYRDGTAVDCSLSDMYFRNLSGIFEYKLYFQSPPYRLGSKPEGGGAGSADNLFFENVDVVADRPGYPPDIPGIGYFGMFFMNSNIGYISLENIRYTTNPHLDSQTYLVAVGPMTWPAREGVVEIFDPYISSTVDTLELENIFVDGERATDVDGLVKVIEFDDVNHDGFSSGKGKVNHIFLDGKERTDTMNNSCNQPAEARYLAWASGGKDDVCNILMIGNSFCQNYSDELYAMAKAAGIPCRITSVIAGACTLVMHWDAYANAKPLYQVITYDENGCTTKGGETLEYALALADWDVISYQDGEHYYRIEGVESAKAHMEPYLGNLVSVVRSKFPRATHYFHQVWAYQVGYYRPVKSEFKVSDRAVQATMHKDLREMTLDACARHDLLRIPTGDAWDYARTDERIGDNLCMEDNEHDSEQNGGQYLNACVWFETLFGKSCVGNFIDAPYLSRDRMAALQEMAHRAVAETCGAAYASDVPALNHSAEDKE